ncbi:MAG: sulfatase [Planctomycetota bacterium JB042]
MPSDPPPPAPLLRPFAYAAAAALVVHAVEAGFAARADNALLDALPPAARLRYLLLIVLAFSVPALVGGLVALPLARGRPRAAAGVAALLGAAIPAVEAFRHLDDVRGPALAAFGAAAAAVALLAGGVAAARTPTVRSRAGAAGVAVLAVAGILLAATRVAGERSGVVRDGGEARAATSRAASPPPRDPPPPARNLLVLLVDTLRADHLGCYGYPRDTSPHVDAFAREGVLFERAATPKPKTSPAVASFFTGTWPQTHRVHRTSTVLPDEATTIAEILSGAGFATCGVSANVNVAEVFNYHQGFDRFTSVRRIKEPGRRVDKHAGRVRDTFLEWLEERGDDRWFGYVHFIDPHSPYRPPPGYRERFEGDALDGRLGDRPDLPMLEDDYIDGIHRSVWLDAAKTDLDEYVSRYDGEIAFTDEAIRDVLRALDRLGHADDTVVVFTADHGESIDEHHAYFNHGLFPYEEQVHVPLVVRGPGLARDVRRGEEVSLVSLMPTLLELVGVPIPETVDGTPFTPALLPGATADAGTPTFVSARSGRRHGIRGVRLGDAKYLERAEGLDPSAALGWRNVLLPGKRLPHSLSAHRNSDLRRELYDLAADPGESRNLAWRRPEEADRFSAMLAAHREAAAPIGPKPKVLDRDALDAETGDELEQMGYLGRTK